MNCVGIVLYLCGTQPLPAWVPYKSASVIGRTQVMFDDWLEQSVHNLHIEINISLPAASFIPAELFVGPYQFETLSGVLWT